jgi:predicted GH43/DUF377 family glycosyl hydrolase
MASKWIWSVVLFVVVLLVAAGAAPAAAGSGPVGWTKYPPNPVFDVGATGAWDSGNVYDPVVLYDGSTYRMWYTGDQGGNPRRIGYATSTNGLTWTRSAVNAVLSEGDSGSWDDSGVRGAAVISDGGLFKMWYTGNNAAGDVRIGYATSNDGITWNRYGSNPVLDLGPAGAWDDLRVSRATVLKDGSTYKMWYEGRSSSGAVSFGYATSTDGIIWNKYAGNPVLTSSPAPAWDYSIYSPHVILADGVYHMWYAGGNFSGTAYETGYATSADGIQWTKRGRVIQQGPDGAFDRYGADFPTVLRVGDMAKMWYSGYDGSTYRIGYASAPWLDLDHTAYLPLAQRNAGACTPLWSDDFSDYHSGWPIEDETNWKCGYTGGEYQMIVRAPGWSVGRTAGLQMADGAIAVRMRFATAGDARDNGGIHFGIQPDQTANFYRLAVSRDGSWAIQRHGSSGYHDLAQGAAASYQPYPGTNRLKVVRSGAAIMAYLNGQWLATVSDGNYMGSLWVGLVAGTDAGNADVRFDDYAIYPVSCGD